jgi:hypothetical protein
MTAATNIETENTNTNIPVQWQSVTSSWGSYICILIKCQYPT